MIRLEPVELKFRDLRGNLPWSKSSVISTETSASGGYETWLKGNDEQIKMN